MRFFPVANSLIFANGCQENIEEFANIFGQAEWGKSVNGETQPAVAFAFAQAMADSGQGEFRRGRLSFVDGEGFHRRGAEYAEKGRGDRVAGSGNRNVL